MSIQHSQQIQHIRHAKQYTEFARRPVSRPGRRRRFGVAVTAITAMVGFSGAAFMTSAQAQHPTEGSSGSSAASTSDTNTVSSPCFRGPTAPFGAYEAAASECTHTYGAPDTRFGAEVGGPSGTAAETDGWAHHMPPSDAHEQVVPEETDGWAHQIDHIQVPGDANTAIDGWAHHSPSAPNVGDNQPSWKDCFFSHSSYQAWKQVQFGMPRCNASSSAADTR